MWLNTKGDDVPCPSSSNTSVIQVLDADGVTEAYKRVSTVVPDCCVEHLVAAVGEDVAFSGDEQQLCEVDEFHQPTDAKDFAYCVVCGVSLCKLCMGDKYFPKTIHVRSKAGDSKETGFEVKSSPQCGCFVCHDCFEDEERLKSAWMIRAYQKLLRTLNHRDSWKMDTKMQLHRHDSVAPGRYIYTLEHINSDFSGNKCGRCVRCFNPFRKAGCKSMTKRYSQGVFVYEFDEDPDVAYSGDTDTEDDAAGVATGAAASEASEEDDPADPDTAGPSSRPQHASSSGSKEAGRASRQLDRKSTKPPPPKPAAPKTAAAKPAAPKTAAPKPVAPKPGAFSASAHASLQYAERSAGALCLEVELVAINKALQALQRGQAAAARVHEDEMAEMKNGLKRQVADLNNELAGSRLNVTARESALTARESELRLIREERDKLKTTEATFVERLRLATVTNAENEKQLSWLVAQQKKVDAHMEKASAFMGKMGTHMENTHADLKRLHTDSFACSKQAVEVLETSMLFLTQLSDEKKANQDKPKEPAEQAVEPTEQAVEPTERSVEPTEQAVEPTEQVEVTEQAEATEPTRQAQPDKKRPHSPIPEEGSTAGAVDAAAAAAAMFEAYVDPHRQESNKKAKMSDE